MIMKYYMCGHDIYGDASREEYYEVGDHGFVTRQVYIFPHAVVTSRRDYDPLVGGTLCDQPFYSGDMTGLVETSQEEFEAAWSRPDPRESGK